MKINIYDSMQRPKLLHSWEAEKGALDMLERIESMELALEILPNEFSQFAGLLEEKDYMSYRTFLESVKGRAVLKTLEEFDEK